MAKEYIKSKCGSCSHSDACAAWIRHCSTLYGDFAYSVSDCPYYLPAADVIPRAAYTQCAWERDTAMKQLEEHGIAFGYAAPDVVEVVRCRDCKSCRELNRNAFGEEAFAEGVLWCMNQSDGVFPDDFCSYGERRDDNATC